MMKNFCKKMMVTIYYSMITRFLSILFMTTVVAGTVLQFRTCQFSENQAFACYTTYNSTLVPSDHCYIAWSPCPSGHLEVSNVSNVTTELCIMSQWLWECMDQSTSTTSTTSTVTSTTTVTTLEPTTSSVSCPETDYGTASNPFLWTSVIFILLFVLILVIGIRSIVSNKIYPFRKA
jgi:hypothetical protein